MKSRKRKLERDLDVILASVTDCPLGSELLGYIRRARDQLLTFCDFARKVDATNNVSERALTPSVIQRKSPMAIAPDGLQTPRPHAINRRHRAPVGMQSLPNHTRCHLRLIAKCSGWVSLFSPIHRIAYFSKNARRHRNNLEENRREPAPQASD